jgi:predicted Zn-dependent protease
VRRLALLGVWAAATLTACSDPATPDRECQNCYYSFADTFPPDTFIFHWPANRLPVRFWADPRGAMPYFVRNAIAVWQRQFLYEEFRGTIVTDSSQADVIAVWDAAPIDSAAPDTGATFACSGDTHSAGSPEGTLAIDSTKAMVGPIVIGVFRKAGYTSGQLFVCGQRLTIHEMGHALGILRHSPYPDDIMSPTPTVDLPSAEDRRTIEVLYHTTPTIVPPPR